MRLPLLVPTFVATLLVTSLPTEAKVGRYFLAYDQVEGSSFLDKTVKRAPGISHETPDTESSEHFTQNSDYNFSAKATGYRVKGFHTVELSWLGTTSAFIDIYREGKLISTIKNSGNFVDSLNSKSKGISYTYELCESKTTVCSNHVTYTF